MTIIHLSTNYRPTISTRQQSKPLTAGHKIAYVPVQALFQLAARSLLVNIATSGTRIHITVGGAITLTRVSCSTPLSTVLCFIVPNPLIRKNRPPIDHILLLRQRPIHPFQMVLLHGSRLHFLLIRICTVYVLSHDISTLGAAKWPLTPATKISFFRVLRMVFILSTTCLLFPPRTVRII